MFNKFVQQAGRRATWISKPTALIGVLALLGVAFLTIANVLGRWLLDQPLVGIHDLFGLAIIMVVATCFPTGVMQRTHIAIRFLGTGIGPRTARVMDTIGALATAGFLALIAWQVSVEAINKTATGEYTLVMKLPTGPIWLAASAVLWISVPMQLVVCAQIANGQQTAEQDASDHG